MKDCEYYRELISRLIDREISPEEGRELAEHARECEDCRRVYDAFTALSGMLSDELVEPPEELRENVMASVRRAEIKKKNRLAPRTIRIVAAAAAAALVIGAGAFTLPRIARAKSAKYSATSAEHQYSTTTTEKAAAGAAYDADNGAYAYPAEVPQAPAPMPDGDYAEPEREPTEAAAPEAGLAAPSAVGDGYSASDTLNDFFAAPGAEMQGRSEQDMISEAAARAAEKETSAVTVDVTGQGRGARISSLLTGTSGSLPSDRTADRRFLLRYDVNGVSTQVLISVYGEKVFFISLSGEESDMVYADCSWTQLSRAIYD